MGILDLVDTMKKLADDPNLSASAAGIGKAASELMPMLERIATRLESMDKGIDIISVVSMDMWKSLEHIAAGIDGLRHDFDALRDPVPRPPFTPDDVQAMMKNNWPPDQWSAGHYAASDDRVKEIQIIEQKSQLDAMNITREIK